MKLQKTEIHSSKYHLPRALAAALVAAVAVSGCGAPSGAPVANGTSSTGPVLAPGTSGAAAPAPASNELVVISPHSKEIQDEFTQAYAAKQPNVHLKWIDEGGTSDDLKYVESQFQSAGDKTKGINVDVFFGGGSETFLELEKGGLLAPMKYDSGIPPILNGQPLLGKDNDWIAAALSGFGILANKAIATRDGLPTPAEWSDLGNPKLKGRIELADPRHSGSAHLAYEIILQSNGWDQGWRTLMAMAANTRTFVTGSSQLPQDVASGEAVFAPMIDFYARGAVLRAGADKLTYIEPKGQTVVTADPIAILDGAPHADMALDFVKFVLSPDGQKLWMLQKGAPGGPHNNALIRLAAVPSLYHPIPAGSLIQSDPFAQKNAHPFDTAKAALRRKALDDLIGTVIIDNLDDLKSAAEANPGKVFVPVSESDLAQLAPKWSDQTFRLQKIKEWGDAARKFYGQ